MMAGNAFAANVFAVVSLSLLAAIACCADEARGSRPSAAMVSGGMPTAGTQTPSMAQAILASLDSSDDDNYL